VQARFQAEFVANQALLLAMYSTDPRWDHDGWYFRDALLGANYFAPILWLSLFDTDGLVTWPSIHDGSPYRSVIQPTSECTGRSRTRLEDWSRRRPQVFAGMSEPWLSYVCGVDAYLAIWTEELTWFYREEERESRWCPFRGGFSLAAGPAGSGPWRPAGSCDQVPPVRRSIKIFPRGLPEL
jgi:hypothetical protein